jgi:hypothetical protein
MDINGIPGITLKIFEELKELKPDLLLRKYFY